MKLKTISLFFVIYTANCLAQSDYYHYVFSRKLEREHPKINTSDTIECYYKKGLDSAQLIFLKHKRNGTFALYLSDTLYTFNKNKIWEYGAQDYLTFYSQSYQTLFPPLLNDGRCYKKYFKDERFKIAKYDTTIEGVKYLCIDEKTNSRYENYDSMSLIHYFYKGVPIKYHSYIKGLTTTQLYESNIITIDSNDALIKLFLDSLLKSVKSMAIKYSSPKKEIKTERIDTALLVEEFLNLNKINNKTKIQIIDLWYRACVPCILSIPTLNSLSQNPELNIIGVNYKDSNLSDVKRFLKKFNVKYNLIYDTNTTLKKLNCGQFPTIILYNPLNKKYKFYIGYNEKTEKEDLQNIIKEISVE